MSKKEEEKRKIEWKRHCFAVSLVANLKKYCDNIDRQTNHAHNGCDNNTIKLDTLTAVLSDKTTVIYKSLTLKGYLVVIARLFKEAFLHKKADGITKSFWGIVE